MFRGNTHTRWLILLLLSLFLLLGCTGNQSQDGAAQESDQTEVSPAAADDSEESTQAEQSSNVAEESERDLSEPDAVATELADVLSVEVSGSPNDYRFSVEIESPDTGCQQYADWWEVLTEDGELLYRRILAHSHVNEQPFVRSGGPVEIEEDEVVVVRAHMHPGGYGGQAMRGTVQTGFEVVSVEPDFVGGVERESPQPTGCQF